MHSKFIRSEFEKLYINYHPRLLAYVQRFINDNSTAQDLVQDSFMVLWNKQISHDTEETRRLLFVIARNRCLNYLKHKNIVDRHRYQLQAQVKIGEERLYNYDFSFIENEHPFLYQELECQIQRIMNSLPERCREVFVLSRFDGLKNREISERLKKAFIYFNVPT